MRKPPSLWEYLLVFREHMFAAMSGGVSVPFAVAGVWVDNKYAQIIFWALAITSFGFAAYRVWAAERHDVVAAEAKLAAVTEGVAYSLTALASVEVDLANPKEQRLEWHLAINTTTRALQYGPVDIRATIDGEPEIRTMGRSSIVRPGFGGVFKFAFPDGYASRDGELIVSVVVDYGLPNAEPLRHLSHKMRVKFQHRGVVAFSDCKTVELTETPVVRAIVPT